MLILLVLAVLSLFASVSLAEPLQIASNDQTSNATQELIDAAFAANVSNTSPSSITNVSIGENSFNIKCDGTLYGFTLNYVDCGSAVDLIINDDDQTMWGQRHTGLPDDVFPLPFAVFGNRAECFVSTELQGARLTGSASFLRVKNTASAINLQCAAGHPPQGGIATDIGGDNNLAVVLGSYQPRVQCGNDDIFTEATSCGRLLADMPALKTRIVFGPAGEPNVQRKLPLAILSYDGKCLLRVFSTGRADTASWYDIWEATEATFAVCARRAKFGNFRGLGDNGNIFLTLTSLPRAEDLGNISSLITVE